jgi:hypothetical protein
MRRAVLGAVALLVVVAVLLMLTGCGGDPKADPSPSPSSPATSPVSTTPSAPVMPEAAKADTTAGALAFVKYYVSIVNHAAATGDTLALSDASSPSCESCRDVIQKMSDLYSAGGHSEGGVWRLVETKVTSVGEPWRVSGHVSYTRQTIVRPGSPDETFEPGEYDMEFTLRYRTGQWQVNKWVRS